ncbi:protein Tob1-like [Limulus polyphemus]|uniref:Protein Tob1-like n=1 Tax=Limulus polyphemus TaxID=6850 RepID=A0ABM1C0R7_LIMPO|nr:protein Tob1-like [Limulus polyphemus]
MRIEVQVALNFLISFLYNKLPRRRVNQYAEELEKALRQKFAGHWYPERPLKGSGYRCLKTTIPLDPVFGVAAALCSVDLDDIQANLPKDLSIWIDPGEVSYRLGEKGLVKGLYDKVNGCKEPSTCNFPGAFNPDAQCFKPLDNVTSNLIQISLSHSPSSSLTSDLTSTYVPNNSFPPNSMAPLTFTTATFAQTKFGSTKLKHLTKKCHSTELGSHINQRTTGQQTFISQHRRQLPSMSNPSPIPEATANIFGSSIGPSIHPVQQTLSSKTQNHLDTRLFMRAPTQQPRFPMSTVNIHDSLPIASTQGLNVYDKNNFDGLVGDLDSTKNITNLTTSGSILKVDTSLEQLSQCQVSNQFPAFFDKSAISNIGKVSTTQTFSSISGLGEVNFEVRGWDSSSTFTSGGATYPNYYPHLLSAS